VFGASRPLPGLCFLAIALASGCGSRSGLEGLLPARSQLAVQPPENEPSAQADPPLLDPALERLGCVDITRSYTSVPATVMLLIDQSQSMSFRFGDSTRWDVLRQAMVDPDHGLLASLDPNASLGLMLFTGQNGFTSPLGCPILTRVEAKFGNVDAVRSAYLAAEPMFRGDTPTGESIDQAALALAAIANNAPKYILLATDGEPDTCAQPKPQAGLPQALEAAQRAFAQGIRVYTLGVSDGLGAWRLQELANAGAGKDPSLVYGTDADAEEPISASSDPHQLAEQLKGIIGDVRSCVIDLGTTVGREGALDGRLVLDGQQLRNDPRNGWTFVDPRTVQIHGSACDQILGDGQRLEVRFPCVNDFAPPR
jgi:von Willebrand factor type A domain